MGVRGLGPHRSRGFEDPGYVPGCSQHVGTAAHSIMSPLSQASRSRTCRLRRRKVRLMIDAASCHQRPGDACRLVGEGDRHFEASATSKQPLDPGILLDLLRPLQGRLCSDDEQATDVGVTLMCDPAKTLFPACGPLPRNEAEPGCELAA